MINILWMLFEIAVNIYQGFMAVYFVYAFLGGEGIKKFFTMKNIAFSTVYAIRNVLLRGKSQEKRKYIINTFLRALMKRLFFVRSGQKLSVCVKTIAKIHLK